MDLPDSIADKFTADEIREYVEQFKEVDDDGSGFLDPEEIGQLLKSLGNDKWDDDEYIKQLIEAVDEDMRAAAGGGLGGEAAHNPRTSLATRKIAAARR